MEDQTNVLQPNPQRDRMFMGLALEAAAQAEAEGEVPVGAVLVASNGAVVARAGNKKEQLRNPLKHAETVAFAEGIAACGKYLSDLTLFVTLEPCAMCAGAAINVRLGRLVFGASDPKGGAAGSSIDVFANPSVNHRVAVTGGVRAAECAALLSDFFKRKREGKKCL